MSSLLHHTSVRCLHEFMLRNHTISLILATCCTFIHPPSEPSSLVPSDNGSFASCRLGPPWNKHVPANLTYATQIGLAPWVILDHFLRYGGAHCPTGGAVPSGSAVARRLFIWSIWLLEYNEMINVTGFTTLCSFVKITIKQSNSDHCYLASNQCPSSSFVQ